MRVRRGADGEEEDEEEGVEVEEGGLEGWGRVSWLVEGWGMTSSEKCQDSESAVHLSAAASMLCRSCNENVSWRRLACVYAGTRWRRTRSR